MLRAVQAFRMAAPRRAWNSWLNLEAARLATLQLAVLHAVRQVLIEPRLTTIASCCWLLLIFCYWCAGSLIFVVAHSCCCCTLVLLLTLAAAHSPVRANAATSTGRGPTHACFLHGWRRCMQPISRRSYVHPTRVSITSCTPSSTLPSASCLLLPTDLSPLRHSLHTLASSFPSSPHSYLLIHPHTNSHILTYSHTLTGVCEGRCGLDASDLRCTARAHAGRRDASGLGGEGTERGRVR